MLRCLPGRLRRSVITRLEGLVAKFMGDGVLCYFGWPRAHEDEAERAVRAGLAIVRSCGQLIGGGQALACRVGHCYRARGRRRCRWRGVGARGNGRRRDPEPRRPTAGHRTARGGRDRPSTQRLLGRVVRARGSRASNRSRDLQTRSRLARAWRACCRQPFRGAHDRADTAGRARGGGGASRRALASGPARRRSGGAALRRTRDRQVPYQRAPSTSGSMACRSCRLRHQCSPYYRRHVAPPADRASGASCRLPTGRSRPPQGWTSSRPCWQRRRTVDAMRRH